MGRRDVRDTCAGSARCRHPLFSYGKRARARRAAQSRRLPCVPVAAPLDGLLMRVSWPPFLLPASTSVPSLALVTAALPRRGTLPLAASAARPHTPSSLSPLAYTAAAVCARSFPPRAVGRMWAAGRGDGVCACARWFGGAVAASCAVASPRPLHMPSWRPARAPAARVCSDACARRGGVSAHVRRVPVLRVVVASFLVVAWGACVCACCCARASA